MKPKVVALSLLFGQISIAGTAQVPPPVDIPIPNILQESPVWCWAAVAQQIIVASVGWERTPPQCALVAIANGVHPSYCCSGYNPQCVTVGNVPQIQFLISRFGGHYSSLAPPADPMTIYRTLASNRPIILHIQSGFASSHVVVLRGMSFVRGRFGVQAVLHINDPLSYFTQPVPFESILPIWREAIVVN